MEGSSQDYICKSDFLKNVLSCLPNRQWIHQQALMDGGADDNLSFLEHSGQTKCTSMGTSSSCMLWKCLWCWKTFMASLSPKRRCRVVFVFQAPLRACGERLNCLLPPMSCVLVKEPQLPLGKWAFSMSQQKIQQGCLGATTGMAFFWHDDFISQPVHLVEEKVLLNI